MKQIVIFSQSEAQLDEFKHMVERELGSDRAQCALTAFSDTKILMNYLVSSGAAVDVLLFDLCRQNPAFIKLATTIAKLYPDIDLMCISKPPYSYEDAGSISTARVPDYILSTPISIDDLQKPFSNAVTTLTKYESGKLTLFTKGQVYRLRHSRIDYIVSNNRQLTLHGGENELCVYAKLGDLEEELGEDFIRCHQSYLVNINRIMAFSQQGVKLVSGVKIPVSKSRYEKAYAAFLQYTGYAGIGDCGSI